MIMLCQVEAKERGVQPFPLARLSSFRLGQKQLFLTTDAVNRLLFRRNCKVVTGGMPVFHRCEKAVQGQGTNQQRVGIDK